MLFPCTNELTLFCLHFNWDWCKSLLPGPLALSLDSFQFSFYIIAREFLQKKPHQSLPRLKVLQGSPLSIKQTPWPGIKRFHDLAPVSFLQTFLPLHLSTHNLWSDHIELFAAPKCCVPSLRNALPCFTRPAHSGNLLDHVCGATQCGWDTIPFSSSFVPTTCPHLTSSCNGLNRSHTGKQNHSKYHGFIIWVRDDLEGEPGGLEQQSLVK